MRLAVNIDHIATVRQARRADEPDPVAAALLAEAAGAHGITVHLRGDRRHIQDRDLQGLRTAIATKLNIEMAVTEEMGTIASKVHPDQVTLVPERPEELTTEGGLDVTQNVAGVKAFVRRMRADGIAVSIFLDPAQVQVRAATDSGAQAVEINTGRYAETTGADAKREFDRIVETAEAAAAAGLEVLAGHGLNYVNVIPIVGVSQIVELNIGHSIVARAALLGMDRAVRDMVALLRR